jgi:site-specific recombinase XerD
MSKIMYISFFCRPSKQLQNGLSPIEVSVTIGKERRVIRLPKYVRAEDFNVKKQRVKRNEVLNRYLDAVKVKFTQIETEMLKRNMPITTRTVIDVFQNGFADTNVTFLSLFDKHNEDAKTRSKRGLISPVTYQKYLLTRKMFADFLRTKLHRGDILLVDITPTMIEQFYIYLNGLMAKNTAIHKMKVIKKILKIAMEEGYIRAMPFKVKLVKDTLQYTPLSVDELRTIRSRQFETARMAQVRDVFIFACYSGLAFTDLKNLTKDDMLIDEDGKEWIVKPRQKTKIISHIPLLPIAKELWEKYDYKLPVLTNQKYNSYLKELADVCGINKNLHSHLARHTFATILLNSGVDMVSVSKILGHSNSRITEKTYAQMMPETIMKRVIEVADQLV